MVVGEGVRPQTRWFHQPGIAGPPGLPQPRLYVPCPRWREGKFQEVVEAEYVLLEMNGLFTYTYSLTAGTAGCSAQPQNWTTITQTAGDTAPFSWDREVRPVLLSSPRAGDFRSCAVCAGSRLDLFRLLLTEHQRPQGLLTAAWVSHGSWRLKFNIKVPADLGSGSWVTPPVSSQSRRGGGALPDAFAPRYVFSPVQLCNHVDCGPAAARPAPLSPQGSSGPGGEAEWGLAGARVGTVGAAAGLGLRPPGWGTSWDHTLNRS